MAKWVYSFGDGSAEGRAEMKNLLGGKGANLAEMANLGLPVPPGFTITTEVCTYFYANRKSYPKELEGQVATATTVVSLRPRLSTVSIMPGIEALAPERTETRSGFLASPNLRLVSLATELSASSTSARNSPG